MSRLHAFIFMVCFTVVFLPAGLSAESDINQIISSWQGKYDRLSSYTATYIQSVYEGEELKGETSGMVFFKKPHFFRWEVKSPEEQIIVGNGEIVWVYVPGFNQVVKRTYSPENSFGPFWFTSTEPIKRIKSNFIIKKPFTVKHQGKQIEILEFIPRREIPDIKKVHLWMDPDKFLPLRVEVFLNDGTLTRFIYKDIKMDVSLSDALFQLKIPDGIEVFED